MKTYYALKTNRETYIKTWAEQDQLRMVEYPLEHIIYADLFSEKDRAELHLLQLKVGLQDLLKQTEEGEYPLLKEMELNLEKIVIDIKTEEIED